MDTAPNNTHTQRISILLMCIVDTVAQVAARGQWRPLFDISGKTASLAFRPKSFDYSKPSATWPPITTLEARIVPYAGDDTDAQEQVEALEAMLTSARRHLDSAPLRAA